MSETILAVVGVLVSAAGVAVSLWLANRQVIPRARSAWSLRVFTVRRRGHRVRVSAIALADVHDRDEWCLVRLPEDRPGEFGPLGGAFKFEEAADVLLSEFGFAPESSLASRASMTIGDIRGFLPVQRLHDFLAWWRVGDGRESGERCVVRELREELGEVGRHDLAAQVDQLRFRRLRSIVEGPRWIVIPEGGYWQVRLFEVYLARRDESISRAIVLAIMAEAKHGNGLLVVTAEDIRRGRVAEGTVGGHTEYLLGKTRSRFEPPGRKR